MRNKFKYHHVNTLVFLHYSRHLREFCGFTKVPDASKITRFKQDFLLDLQSVFDKLVDITEPICRDIDNNLASMLLFDTSGIEAYVTENNPKYANRIIRQLKSYAKSMNFDSSYDPYKVAYASMPTSASSNHEVKQQYINSVTLTSSVLLPMDLELFAPLISTTRIILLPILTL